ncbi:ABC transporter ATP-binding protein [Curtobacterium ammoniigenes]|uniref:ABC transporter ATP-binding protein n=1 Tax=Curtobacterium ammoniigenes TaxID=395387 RepID=UPI0008334D6D|nr:ABC transporter ATP-binding protein [Curtobacterium ammoniigenes]
MADGTAIRVRRGSKQLAGRTILRDVSFDVDRGSSCAILGRSGSGKSTLLAILGLLDRFDSGDLQIADHNVGELSPAGRDEYRRRHIGFVFQRAALIRHLNVFENVAVPLRYASTVGRRELRLRVGSALASVALEGFESQRPTELSGGEQQRVAVARALVTRPTVLLADEPTGALDAATADHVISTMLSASERDGTSVVVVTHDSVIARRMERSITLVDGQA